MIQDAPIAELLVDIAHHVQGKFAVASILLARQRLGDATPSFDRSGEDGRDRTPGDFPGGLEILDRRSAAESLAVLILDLQALATSADLRFALAADSDAAARRNSENLLVNWRNPTLPAMYLGHFERNHRQGKTFQLQF